MAQGSLFGISLCAYLAGTWRIERRIDDVKAQGKGTFEGEGRFIRYRGDMFRYREQGMLTMNGQSFPSLRDYVWTFDQDGADISFADGRFFHRLQVSGDTASAHHHCAPDDYRVNYRFEAPDRWHQAWQVNGPRKDYTLESVFTRLHPAALPVHSAHH